MTESDLRSTLNLPKTDFPMKANLSQAEPRRLEQWKTETELLGFSERETQRFASAFSETLVRKRHTLLFQNHIERLNSIVAHRDARYG